MKIFLMLSFFRWLLSVVCYQYGELAQLGERLPCTQEVSGSIPLFSTNEAGLRVYWYIGG